MNCNKDAILKQKLAIVFAANVASIAFDAFANYRMYNKQLNGIPPTSVFSPTVSNFVKMQITNNNIKGICHALGSYGDVQYLLGDNAICDPTDLDSLTTNFPWMVLHLTKTLVRSLELANS
jgi:hypothetical protein